MKKMLIMGAIFSLSHSSQPFQSNSCVNQWNDTLLEYSYAKIINSNEFDKKFTEIIHEMNDDKPRCQQLLDLFNKVKEKKLKNLNELMSALKDDEKVRVSHELEELLKKEDKE
jgi:hypothetical protein